MLRGNEFFYDQEETPQYVVQTTAAQYIRDPKLFTVKAPAPTKAAEKKDENKKEVGCWSRRHLP
jgi:hypothetical protein